MDPDGSSLHAYRGIPPQSKDPGAARISGFALTDEGQVFVTMDPFMPETRRLFTLDRKSESWLPVSIPSLAGSTIPTLKGSEGASLAFPDAERSSIRFFAVSP